MVANQQPRRKTNLQQRCKMSNLKTSTRTQKKHELFLDMVQAVGEDQLRDILDMDRDYLDELVRYLKEFIEEERSEIDNDIKI